MQQVQALTEAGKWKEAEAVLDASLTSATPGSAILLWKAYIEFRTGRYAASAANARACLEQEPSNGRARKILGLDLFLLGDGAAAEQELQRAVTLLPEDEEAQYYLGRLYFTRQNMPAAQEAFQMLLSKHPGSVRGHNQLGQTLEALNRISEAQAEYQQAIALDRSAARRSEWPYYNLGVLHLRTGHAQTGADLLREALQIRPRFPEAQIKLAVAFGDLGQTEAAERVLETLVREQPDNADAHYQLGRLCLKRQERQKAAEHFQQFEALRKK